MSKFTKGPWMVASINKDTDLVIHSKHITIAKIVKYGNPNEKNQPGDIANAQAIAALPELVEVCQNFFEWHANHFEDFSPEINMELLCLANQCEQALAKVRGKEGER